MNDNSFSAKTRDYSIAYGEHTVVIQDKSFPIGSFAVDAMNIDKSVIDELIEVSKPVVETYRRLQSGAIGFDELRGTVPDVLKLVYILRQRGE